MTKNKSRYNWDTQFETAKSLMVHKFTNRVQVETNIKSGEVLVMIDGNTVNTYHNMPVKEYEKFLLGIEEYAYQLQHKDYCKRMLGIVTACIITAIGILAAWCLIHNA